MTATRVQPIDNESGRCSDWFARQPALPSCRFAYKPIQSPVLNYGPFYPTQERSFYDRSLVTNTTMPPYEVSISCTEPSVLVDTQCTQFRDCLPGSTKNCQLGPIDVEDLALYFDADKSQSNCLPRVDRSNRRARPMRYGSYPNDKQLVGFPTTGTDFPCDEGWLNGQFCNSCPQPFAFCTEERWLQCPASDRCPLYDTTYSYEQNVLPPCAYEDLGNGYCEYGYTEDEQLLEDYLSNEKRKEKSRDAARCRRSKETDIFTEMAAALPVAPEQAAHLDKASVMRLAIAYLKVRSVVDSIPGPLAKSETNQMDELFTKAMNGFMLVLSNDGSIIYLSENVSDYLGVSQMDMLGQSVYEYSHPCDHEELREYLSTKPSEITEKRVCSFFLRFKCTLTGKGRKVNLKSASYKVIHCTGRLAHVRDPVSNSNSDEEDCRSDDEMIERDTGVSLVVLGCPIPHPSNIEIPLGRQTFLSKHSLSMKFTYADEKLAEYLGWNSEELMGQSVFEFYHALDNFAMDKSFKSLFSKGQCETVAYRFLGKRGGYAWVVTQATLIHCVKQQKPQSVVCVNYILSGVEREDEVYSVRQLAARETEAKAVKPKKSEKRQIHVQIQVKLNTEKFVADELEDEELQECSLPTVKPELIPKTLDPVQSATNTDYGPASKPKKKLVQLQDGSRKDSTFPRPVQPSEKSSIGVQALKDSLEESLKENSEPLPKRAASTPKPFVFQGKPAVEYDPETAVRQDRPHVVTRHLFASIASQPEPQITCRPPPQTATASIFAPRTEDMNKGFLTFSEDQPGLTMLKDEPEDLTHLAPTPGDVCVPLEDTPFLTDMLDEFILGNDNYCPLLSPCGTLAPELRSADFGDPLKDTELVESTRNKSLGESLADSDPFMYGDSPSSPCSIDPSTVSPPLTKYRQSPEQSIDSLGSPTCGSGAEGMSEDEMLMLGLNDSIADDEMALRAPYIPMSDQDEALDLLISNDMVMWSPPQTTDQKNCLKWMVTEKEQRTSDSSLAQLLKTDQVVSRKYNDHGGGLVNPVQVLGQIPRRNTNLDNCQWSSKVDRPTKRIHTASIDTGNDNKRIKCEESAKHSSLEDQLLSKQPSSRKSSTLGSSQLLRRLVSQQNVLRNNFANESFDGSTVNGRQSDDRMQLELNDGEGDSGGGDEDGGCRRNGESVDGKPSSQRNSACNSVLMNLLVSGCDEKLTDSRSVPSIYPKSLATPLIVNLEDHQMVPQCSDSSGSSSPFDQLSPIARKELSNAFIGQSIVSPASPIASFDGFDDYEPSMTASGLLQVEPDLFGSLLDRSLA